MCWRRIRYGHLGVYQAIAELCKKTCPSFFKTSVIQYTLGLLFVFGYDHFCARIIRLFSYCVLGQHDVVRLRKSRVRYNIFLVRNTAWIISLFFRGNLFVAGIEIGNV